MSVPGIHYLHAMQFPGTPVVNLVQLDDHAVEFNFEEFALRQGAEATPTMVGAMAQRPDLAGRTAQIADVIGAMTVEDICADFSAGDVLTVWRPGVSGGIRHATADYRVTLDNNAFAYWTGFEAEQRGMASLSYRVVPIFDGTNDPFTLTGVGTNAVTTGFAGGYTLGPISLNGSTVGGVLGVNWTNNVQTEEVDADGQPFLTYAGIQTYAPGFTFRSTDLTLLDTYGGRGATLTAWKLYLRQLQACDLAYGDAETEHVLFAFVAGTAPWARARRVSGARATVEVAVSLNRTALAHQGFAYNSGVAISLP